MFPVYFTTYFKIIRPIFSRSWYWSQFIFQEVEFFPMVSWRNFLAISSYHHHKEIFMYVHLLSSLILKLLQKLFRMGIVWKLLTVFNQIGLSLLHPNKNILALNLVKIRVIVLILVYFLLMGISLTFLKITNSFPQFFPFVLLLFRVQLHTLVFKNFWGV